MRAQAKACEAAFLLALALPAAAAGGSSRLPRWARAAFAAGPAKAYELHAWIRPAWVQGDLDGDGRLDVAALVRERATGKLGVAVLHGGKRPPAFFGAGRAIGNGGDDFSWMDYWALSEYEGRPALGVAKKESAGGLIYWSGKEYQWEQNGD